MINQHTFLNMLRSLHNIDGYQVPELTWGQQIDFVQNPVKYFIRADDEQQAVIFREVAKRQRNTGLRGAGWRQDCPQCVASKFTCDAHFVAA